MPAFVVFEAASRTLALPAGDVVQVLRNAATAPVPGAPPWVRGVLDLRGRVVPVIDVRARLGEGSRPPRPEDQLLVARAGARLVALEVERVVEVRDAEAGEVEEGSLGLEAPLVAGAVRRGGEVVLVQALGPWLEGLDGASR
jgi:purine-binding chemotaxis protein CheW